MYVNRPSHRWNPLTITLAVIVYAALSTALIIAIDKTYPNTQTEETK